MYGYVPHVCLVLLEAEGVRFHGTGVVNDWEMLCVGEISQVLYKSSKCSQLLSRLSSPIMFTWEVKISSHQEMTLFVSTFPETAKETAIHLFGDSHRCAIPLGGSYAERGQ